MIYILSETQKDLLAQYAWSNVLLAFDFDGTLAPIVDDPAGAAMRSVTARRLKAVAQAYPTVVISGRGRADVASRLIGIPLASIVGNHGLEPSIDMEALARRVRDWVPALEAGLEVLRGVVIENKVYSVAVHYRHSPLRRAARQAIMAAVDALGPDVRVIPGKCVVNVIAAHAPHKGLALERLRAKLKVDRAVYVGDDVTDEDVFGLDDPGLLGIRVGRSQRSRAAFYLKNQLQVDTLLSRLVGLRSGVVTRRRTEYL